MGLLLFPETELGIAASHLGKASYEAVHSVAARAACHGTAAPQRGQDECQIFVVEPYPVILHGHYGTIGLVGAQWYQR